MEEETEEPQTINEIENFTPPSIPTLRMVRHITKSDMTTSSVELLSSAYSIENAEDGMNFLIKKLKEIK